MILRRLINTVVTIPLLISTCAILLLLAITVGTWMNSFEEIATNGFVDMVTLLFAAVILLAALAGAIVAFACIPLVITTGTGVFWRRVDRFSFLQDKDGWTNRPFTEEKLVWRFDRVFKGKRLRNYA